MTTLREDKTRSNDTTDRQSEPPVAYNLNKEAPMKDFIIPDYYNYLFENLESKFFAERLVRYTIFDSKPQITPAHWQDVEIFIRYYKRNVESLSDEQETNANFAILLYRIKYVIEHLTKAEIIKVLNKFFAQNPDDHKSVFDLFDQKFHAPVESLFLTQEKLTITKDNLENFDKIFEYPGWIEFTEEANQAIFAKILNNELTDTQIDYFLGASDELRHYNKWFGVLKHILTTTHNAHTFWTAGDCMSIIWRAVPEDEKSQKWFKDQLFEIFWPRVGNIWPLQNEDKIDFSQDDETQILKDSMNWLRVLDDLKERLPELGKDFKLYDRKANDKDYHPTESELKTIERERKNLMKNLINPNL